MTMKKPEKTILVYSTIQISWHLLYSCIRRALEYSRQGSSGFSLEALPNIILGCSAVEAFCNEMSSIVSTFEYTRDQNSSLEDVVGVTEKACSQMAAIKTNAIYSTLERYKKLCSALGLVLPKNYEDLTTLVQVRNGIVHFRACDLRIVNNEGTITYNHDLPDFYNHLKKKKYRGCDLICKAAEPGEITWITRISTPAMALWAIEVVIGEILYVLENIPEGELKQRIMNAYRPSIPDYQTLFHWGQILIDKGAHIVL